LPAANTTTLLSDATLAHAVLSAEENPPVILSAGD